MESRPDRVIPDPAFAGDDGAPDAALVAALAAWAQRTLPSSGVLMALQDARVLVPVVAMPGEVEQGEHGLAREKSSDMAAVLSRGSDGRQALLAFTSTRALAQWDARARPVPVTTRTAATAALQEQAAAVVVDIAGPVTYVVEGEDLRALAAGWRLAAVGGGAGWIGPGPE